MSSQLPYVVFGDQKNYRPEGEDQIDLRHAERVIAAKIAPNLFKGDAFRKTYSASGGHDSTAAYGGETIPTPLAARYVDLLSQETFCRQIFREEPMTAATKEIPIMSSGTSVYRGGGGRSMITEGGSDQASTSISRSAWTSLTLTANKLHGLSGHTTELGEDSLLNFGQIVLKDMSRQMAWAEEKAFIQGEASGTTTSWGAGDPRYSFDGLIWHVYGTNASTGTNWTPDNASPVMWQDGGSDVLTADELNLMIARLEENNFVCDYIVMRPMVAARMRDATEFEMLQSMKDIGQQAALIKGHVFNYYTAKILSSFFMPYGASTGYSGTGLEFVTGTDDSTVIGFDSRWPIIGDRRRLEFRKRHWFHYDVEEIRMTERIAFDVERPIGIAGINDVKLAI